MKTNKSLSAIKSRKRPLYVTLGSLIGLVTGFAIGIAAHEWQHPSLLACAFYLEPLGKLWINVLSIVVIPLIISYIVMAVLSVVNTRTTGRIGALALLVHMTILCLAAALTIAAVFWLIPRFPVDLSTQNSVKEMATSVANEAASDPQGMSPFLKKFINTASLEPVLSPVQKGMLLIIVATFLLALTFMRFSPPRRRVLMNFFRVMAAKVSTLLNLILLLLPFGVFCLSFALAARSAFSAAGAMIYFIVLVSALLLLFTFLLYPLAVVAGRKPLRQFASALLPSQAVAVGTRSSLACLPTLLEGAEKRLRLPLAIAGFVIPLSVSTFRLTRVISSPLKLIFLAHIFDVHLTPLNIAIFVMMMILISFSSPGIPSEGSYVTLPLYLSAGIPIEGVVLLKTVDAIPDIFKTLVNVTEHMTVATIVSRIATAQVSQPSPCLEEVDYMPEKSAIL